VCKIKVPATFSAVKKMKYKAPLELTSEICQTGIFLSQLHDEAGILNDEIKN